MSPTQVIYMPFVLVEKFAELTGCSVKAIEYKIERGQWIEGREWFKAPDGRRLVSLRCFEQWVLQGRSHYRPQPRRASWRCVQT